MQADILKRVTAHGRDLLAIFPKATPADPVNLCRKLRRLEAEANRAATDHCNGDIDGDEWERLGVGFICELQRILNPGDVPIFINGDPRGYSLKIKDEWMREHPEYRLHRDWGGYGIIAPDLTEHD